VFVCILVCYQSQPPDEIEGDEELEDLVKPPRPASPLDYTESSILCEYNM